MRLGFFDLTLAAVLCAAASLWFPPITNGYALTTEAQSRADLIAKVQADPKAIFSDRDGNPQTIPGLISAVRDLVMADKTLLRPIIEALRQASTDEKAAIGTGLGQAAVALLKTDPSYAAEIQEAVAESYDSVAILAFAAVTGSAPIGALGAPGAAGAGAGGTAGGQAVGAGGGLSGAGGGGGGIASMFSLTGSGGSSTTISARVSNAATSVSP